MKQRRVTSALAALALTGTALAAGTGAAQSADSQRVLGTRSLAKVLAADGHRFDTNWRDFDIADKFFVSVLGVKPNSPLRIIHNGRRPVTAFLPTDGAFRRAAVDILGRPFTTERAVYRGLWRAAGPRGAENVLLYHLVSGRMLTFQHLAGAAPTSLPTMQGTPLKVRYRDGRVVLVDVDPDSPNAHILRRARNINDGNRQIAHGISSMLSPVGPS